LQLLTLKRGLVRDAVQRRKFDDQPVQARRGGPLQAEVNWSVKTGTAKQGKGLSIATHERRWQFLRLWRPASRNKFGTANFRLLPVLTPNFLGGSELQEN
jgi:hypothetical protein